MNLLRTLGALVLGELMIVAGWCVDRGIENWQDVPWGSLAMFIAAAGPLVSWFSKPPKQARQEDKRGQGRFPP
jgi:hypothetical protein